MPEGPSSGALEITTDGGTFAIPLTGVGQSTTPAFAWYPRCAMMSGATLPPDLQDRLILPMLNEAVACLREGIVQDADQLDAGAVFATGFAPFRGGPLKYARDRGVAEVVRRLNELAATYGERFRPDPGWELIS